jgi:hypothetical protein
MFWVKDGTLLFIQMRMAKKPLRHVDEMREAFEVSIKKVAGGPRSFCSRYYILQYPLPV